jgi:hypothetical protein
MLFVIGSYFTLPDFPFVHLRTRGVRASTSEMEVIQEQS